MLDLPFSELCNYIAIEMFKNEGAEIRETKHRTDEEQFDYFMSWE